MAEPAASPASPLPAGSGPGTGDSLAAAAQDASLYLHPQTLARLGTLELRARMIVEGVTSGAHRSPYQGFSVEFAQHRPYVPGDDLRHLDWKVFGRTDKLHLKQYQQETNLDLLILVDASGSMRYGSRLFEEASGVGRKTSPDGRLNWSKFDHATAVAAAMGYIALRQGDRVGLTVYADDILGQLRPSSSPGTWRQIVATLSTQPVESKQTNLAKAIDRALSHVTHRSLMVIISDLFMDPKVVTEAMSRLRFRGHDLVLLQILDRRERDFAFDQEVPLEGMEGEGLVKVDPRAIRDAYLAAMAEHHSTIDAAARACGFEMMTIDTHDWLGPPLSAFLARREARLKRKGR
jgi:uncharacterized protein (DUF58 family)